MAYIVAHGGDYDAIQDLPVNILGLIDRWLAVGLIGPRATMTNTMRILDCLRGFKYLVHSALSTRTPRRPSSRELMNQFPEWKDF